MGSSAQIFRDQKPALTEDELVQEFLQIIAPLGYDTEIEQDNGIYITQKDNYDKAVRVWVDPYEEPLYSVNGTAYYEAVFFDFVDDDKRYGPEHTNSDMILAITAEYMKTYPDALFHYEGSDEDSMFFDQTDIDTFLSQPFQPGWFYLAKSHRVSKRVNDSRHDWTCT